jgi:hypothetical protein
MKTKRFICAALLFVAMVFAESASAQLKTSYFMEGSYFRTELNPALAPTRGYIALPLISGYSSGMYSNYASTENFYFERGGQLLSAYDEGVSLNAFLNPLPNRCIQAQNINVNLLGVGFYTLGGTFINFGSNARVDLASETPKDFFRSLKCNDTKVYDLDNMSVNASLFLENYVGLSFNFGENITLGGRVKFLVGLQNINLLLDKAFVTNENGSVVRSYEGEFRLNSTSIDSSKYDGETNPEIEFVGDDWSTFGRTKSFGVAVDFGGELRLFEDHLKLSAAITDLGYIKWSKDTQEGGSIVDLPGDTCDILGFEYSDVMPKHFSDYSKRLTTNINMGAEYNFLDNHFAVGALLHTRIYRRYMMTEFTTSFNVRPTNWMTFTASHTFLGGNTPGIFGAAVNIHPRVVNIFFGMDYIDRSEVDPLYANRTEQVMDGVWLSPRATSFNFYVGIGFNFGRPDFLVEQQ